MRKKPEQTTSSASQFTCFDYWDLDDLDGEDDEDEGSHHVVMITTSSLCWGPVKPSRTCWLNSEEVCCCWDVALWGDGDQESLQKVQNCRCHAWGIQIGEAVFTVKFNSGKSSCVEFNLDCVEMHCCIELAKFWLPPVHYAAILY